MSAFFSFLLCFVIAGDSQSAELQAELLAGTAEFYSQKYNEALSHFEKALQIEPKNIEAVLGRLNARTYLKQKEAAFQQAKTVFPAGSVEAGAVEAHILVWDRKSPEAEKLLKDLIAKNPGFYHTYYQLGYIQWQSKNYDDAITTLNKCIAIKPEFSSSYFTLGDAYRGKGDVNGIIKAWTKYTEIVPHFGTRYEYVANYLKGLSGK